MALKKVGVLWKSDRPESKTVASGSVDEDIPEGSKLLIFRNKWKKADKHPDYTIMIAEDDGERVVVPAQELMEDGL